MDSRFHAPFGIAWCVVIYIATYYYFENGDTFSLLAFGFLGSIFPDVDHVFRLRHRNWFTHSAIVPLFSIVYMLFWNFGRYYDAFYFTLACGLHLLADIKLHGEKGGTYCVAKPMFKKRKGKLVTDYMNVRNSETWYLINGITCLFACFVLYVTF